MHRFKDWSARKFGPSAILREIENTSLSLHELEATVNHSSQVLIEGRRVVSIARCPFLCKCLESQWLPDASSLVCSLYLIVRPIFEALSHLDWLAYEY